MNTNRWLSKLKQIPLVPIRHWFDLRHIMRLRVKVRDPIDGKYYYFIADSIHAYQRAKNMLGKERGTISWLRENMGPDDVFLDIGANIGTFTLFAASHISSQGQVFACEPHLPTAIQLMQNAVRNNLADRISVMTVAVAGEDGFTQFKYKRWRQGASGSQLDVEGMPELKKRVGTELKYGVRIDTLIAQGAIRPPNLIKIDTDGIEYQIVSGMKKLLLSENRPNSIQIEVQVGEGAKLYELMKKVGYGEVSHHANGKAVEMLKNGVSLDKVAYNAIFEPLN